MTMFAYIFFLVRAQSLASMLDIKHKEGHSITHAPLELIYGVGK